jgi:hypothetical protein
MSKLNLKPHLAKLVKSARDKQKNRTMWEMFFVLEQLLIGGKNRKIVTAAIAKRVRKAIDHYRPSPYRPEGFIDSVEQWFNDSIPPQMEGSWIKDIFPEHLVELKKLNHTTDETCPAFSKCGESYLSPKAYLCFFKNAKIVNENGVVISYDNKVFADFTSEIGKPNVYEHTVFKSYINKPQIRKECLATITSTGNTGYFHWIFESLPRLKLLEDVIDESDYLIVPSDLKRFHYETLNHLGFPKEKLLKIEDGSHLLCENLYVPSIPWYGLSKWACDFLRESFIPDDVAEPHKLIYISRKDALYRKIVNEEEVEEYLRSIGFEIVQMSKLPFLEQVRICAEAKVVVGPHGAGLSNTVFCQNAKILEIFSPSYTPSFFYVANQYENEYYYLLGEDASGNSPSAWKDFKISMETFKNILEEMLDNVSQK